VADKARRWSLEEFRDHHQARRRPYDEVLRVDDAVGRRVSVGSRRERPAGPHSEDEIYVVLAGRGSLKMGEDTAKVSAGSVVYVPRGVPHQFGQITEDLEVLVVFAPPESS
jgi:mannose-6-phosphate isomerase-like protein (cupin superfamily)